MRIRNLAANLTTITLLTACTGTLAPAQVQSHCNNDNVCKVAVDQKPDTTGCGANGGNVRIDPDVVTMGQGGSRRIVWQLKEPHWWFCAGDGIEFKPGTVTNGQFSNGSPTSDPNGGNPGPGIPGSCFKFYRLDNANAVGTYGTSYPYFVKFTIRRNPGDPAAMCKTDPFVRNGN